MTISIPKLSLVILIGPSGSGKSTFARKHFLPTEVLVSDACRAMVCDDENDQTATNEAFDLLHFIARKRLALGRLTVVDATNVQPEARKPLVSLAREYHCLPVAIVFDMPEKVCQERNRNRDDRNFGPHVIRQQRSQLHRSLRGLKREGFSHVFVFETPEEVEAATIERVPLWNDKRDDHGPFDIIGDVHGCCDELETLLAKLGYEPVHREADDSIWGKKSYRHPEGRKIVFLGDLVDRGPRILDSLRLVRNMVADGSAYCVPGNHDMKFMRKLRGRDVQIKHGLAESLAEVEALPEEVREQFTKEAAEFLDGLVSHLRPRRRQAGRRPRRHEAGDAGPRLGQGAGVRPLRRNHGRDRRVRPAGAVQLGGGVPGPGDGRLRPHARARARMAEPHDEHRHRLRVRRQADRLALPRAGVRFRSGGPHLLRTGPSRSCPQGQKAPALDRPADARRPAGRRRRARQADHLDPAQSERDDPRRERARPRWR